MGIAINGSGASSAWGQIKKIAESTITSLTTTSPATTTEPAATSPATTTEPSSATSATGSVTTVVASEPASSSAPLTYAAPASSATPTAAVTPGASLTDRLTDSGYYSAPESATVADPVATAQKDDDAGLTQAQIIAQAAYSLVARAGEDDRLSLIQNG
ncbi:hypothetical protein J3E64_002568 [Sphingobium sp. OAS761]|uniref:hypothetical protein n=1 Tax=Sphingobium sp. OAS761 TaxID=2817901 RepID=UPI00209C7F8C|nr:hypothetical protein [Sphingobium sp. OAS761]MCP1470875.1 hypothetical protein [Sphingobium sp. OAS761]